MTVAPSDVVITDTSRTEAVDSVDRLSSVSTVRYPLNTVFLNIYDITELNCFLVSIGLGAHHAGVEIYGKEYAFGGTPHGTGIMNEAPCFSPPHIFRERLALGVTPLSEAQVEAVVRGLVANPMWMGTAYNLLQHNCIHFAETLVEALRPTSPPPSNSLTVKFYEPSPGGQPPKVPEYVSRLQRIVLHYVPERIRQWYLTEDTSSVLRTTSTQV